MTDQGSQPTSITPRYAARIIAGAILLALLLLEPRAYITGRSWNLKWWLRKPLTDVPALFIAGTYDSAFAALLAGIFLLALWAMRHNRRASRIVYGVFLAAAVVTLLAGLINTQVYDKLAQPFNLQWFYYSDFLSSVDAREAMRASLSRQLVIMFAWFLTTYIVLAVTLGKGLELLLNRIRRGAQWLASALAAFTLAVYLIGGHRFITHNFWNYHALANPVYAFGASVVAAGHSSPLLTMKTNVGDEDFRPPTTAPSSLAPSRAPRNLIIFVFESLPAEYVGAYGGKYPVTPNLDRWSNHAAIFRNIYAHAPATNQTLFSLLCSTYPWISYRAITQEKPEIAIPSITSQLKSAGYASGFFFSGDLTFQRAGAFLNARGFDLVHDYRDRKQTRPLYTTKHFKYLDGTDDLTTVESLNSWITIHRDQKFFAMLWTMMTHYPYFSVGNDTRLGPDENMLNTYLNALRYGDAAFGEMMAKLQQRGLLDSTLVVVLGDHGEAFGRHRQLNHGNNIYEENCHVPLILINPQLFHGESYDTIGGVIDIAPTIMDLLHAAPAGEWQGRSLFAADRPPRTYFFAPWSDLWFGYRERNIKVLYNATTGRSEVYDLAADPTEQHNLARKSSPDVADGKQRLAAWVQYQQRLFDRLMK